MDIGHSYNLALFMFGVRDVAGNESVDLHVEMPVLDYEQPRVFVNMKSVTGCADKRALAASWIKDTYGDRLLSALANVTCTPAMSDETLRSRVCGMPWMHACFCSCALLLRTRNAPV